MCEDWFGWQKSCYERREGGEGVMRGRYEKLLWGGFDERGGVKRGRYGKLL